MESEVELREGREALNEQMDAEALSKNKPRNFSVTKKSAAQSMLDLAVLMANSSQLKTILFQGQKNPFYTFIVALLIVSIILQILVGVLLICIAHYDLNGEKRNDRLNKMNNLATLFIFSILIINILITAFGFQDNDGSVSSPP